MITTIHSHIQLREQRTAGYLGKRPMPVWALVSRQADELKVRTGDSDFPMYLPT